MLKLFYIYKNKNKKMKLALKNTLLNFPSIDLNWLNASASYLKRKDRKFLLTEKQLIEVLWDLPNIYQVLDIDNKRIFSYDNVYMDTQDYLFYNQHENKVKSRTKVRTRLYQDANLAFFEYKQKENGITKKYRYQFPFLEHGTMTKGKKRFFDWVYQSSYEEKTPVISPAIRTRYNRLTLVATDGSERLTIDFNIRVQDIRNKKSREKHLKNLVILESKSMWDTCRSVELMKKKWFKRAKWCSKYSLWVVYSGLADKWETFENTVRMIKKIRMEFINNRRRRPAKENIETQLLDNNFKTVKLSEVISK